MRRISAKGFMMRAGPNATRLKRQTATVEVDNPLFNAAYRSAPGNPAKIEVTISLATDPVERMFRRGDLDAAEHRTCKRFRSIFERAGHTGAKSLDFTRPVVDSGNFQNGPPGPCMDAMDALKHVRVLLGSNGWRIMCKVAGEGFAISDAADIYYGYETTRAQKTHIGWFFRDNVDALAKFWGYRNKRAPRA